MSEARGITARVQALRKESVETQPMLDMERARLFTQAYKLYEGTSSVPEADRRRKGLCASGRAFFPGALLPYGAGSAYHERSQDRQF